MKIHRRATVLGFVATAILLSSRRARACLRQLKDPEPPSLWERMKTALGWRTPEQKRKAARDLYSQGVVLYSRGGYAEAIAVWEEVVRKPGAGEWADRAKLHIERAKRILTLQRQQLQQPPKPR